MIRKSIVNLNRCRYTAANCHQLFSTEPPRPKSTFLQKVEREIDASKNSMEWRKPVSERSGFWHSKFKLFGNNEQTSDFISMMQQPIDFSPTAVRNWWNKRKERTERYLQQYIPERNEILGPDLAAAHFILFRGGSVKFYHEENWRKVYEREDSNLPTVFHGGFKLEAIRCDNMFLYYEGLDNLRRLDHLKFLSFRNIKTFDDWCLDRVSGSQCPKLEIIDISGTNCTFRGLNCLYRILSLKELIVDDPKQSIEFELMCANLEEANPKLTVRAAKEVHNLQ